MQAQDSYNENKPLEDRLDERFIQEPDENMIQDVGQVPPKWKRVLFSDAALTVYILAGLTAFTVLAAKFVSLTAVVVALLTIIAFGVLRLYNAILVNTQTLMKLGNMINKAQSDARKRGDDTHREVQRVVGVFQTLVNSLKAVLRK